MSVTQKLCGSKRHRSATTLWLLWLALLTMPAGSVPKFGGQVEKSRMLRALTAVGLVLVSDGAGDQPRPRGSGVIVHQEGIIVTNWHVIKLDDADRQYREVYFCLTAESGASPLESSRYRLQVVAIDRELDLALLRISPDQEPGRRKAPHAWPSIEIGDSRAVELLDDLVVIGFPEKGGVTATISRGIVEGRDDVAGWIKTDTRILHGNSGGAAVNMEGKLIGIATKVEVDRAQIGFQLGTIGYLRPSHLVSLMLDRWRAKGLPEPATATALVRVKGRVKFTVDGRPVAGVRLGLIIAGREVAPESLVTWGGTNADGDFQFEKAVPPGRYTLRARVIGDNRYAVYNREIEITPEPAPLIVEIEAAKNW